jgi:DNA topoisomerase-1
MKTVVIVESVGKVNKIQSYLGNEYLVKASFGHVQDLDKKTLSIEVENNFKPNYIITPDKTKIVKELRDLAKECKEVIIASDEDREGEMIGFSLMNVLKLTNPKRIVFHEITKDAILNAISNPKEINYDMVHAQQARRILDRLVGYKISPVLWKYLSSDAKSAGRVQSVVVRIIIDKEEEINKSISESFFKTSGYFMFKENDIRATLHLNNKLYTENTKEELLKINKSTEFKVLSVENKKSIRKPSPPFITSSLQQEASNKFHYSVKKTMDIAQKLYEQGYITYMRTDSPNISQNAINECKKYIIDTFGTEYSDPKNYSGKDNAQEAHECIRPTYLNQPTIDKLEGDNARLYSLIWKRTIASQMSNAKVNIQTINISGFPKENLLFVSTLENILFDGFLIVYDNTDSDEEKTIGKIEIKEDDILSMRNIKITEEYTKPPLRYNEASLVKYLEKNGIGRPSTFASIISKVIERNYVEIKNIDGVKKSSRQIELDYKFKIKESVKEVFIGREQRKIIPTETGKTVNTFMMTHFSCIMDIKFTSNFETLLDKIAINKANWITVLRNYYDMFNPIVDKLLLTHKKEEIVKDKDILISDNVYKGTGKYGHYVKIIENDKPRYAHVESIENITLEEALEELQYPKTLGKINNRNVILQKGQYGLYLKHLERNYPASNPNITLEEAKIIIESGDSNAINTFKIKDKIVNIKSGEFGPYLQIVSGKKKQNISIPKSYDINKLNISDVLTIIASKNNQESNSKSIQSNYKPKKK